MSAPSILIVDYGVGNLFNVKRAFEALGAVATLSSDPDRILTAERILLPGVGAFAAGMAGLREHSLIEPLQEVARRGTPLLGICLGMQLLMDSSEENLSAVASEGEKVDGEWEGLKLIPGKVRRFSAAREKIAEFKIPQIGWNTIERPEGSSGWENTLLRSVPEQSFMYFVHSYFVDPKEKKDVVAETAYGLDRFCSVIQRSNIRGCQFHPERSGEQGLAILREFVAA